MKNNTTKVRKEIIFPEGFRGRSAHVVIYDDPYLTKKQVREMDRKLRKLKPKLAKKEEFS